MSGRFVSVGTIDSSGEVVKDAPNGESSIAAAKPLVDSEKSKQWEAVQQELEAERRRREEQRVKAASGEGERSLYDVLQANKAAKQAAFEEQTKLRNQFRALDDDEIEFLDEVREKKRAEERLARQQEEEGLKAFRQQQQQKGTGGEGPAAGVADEGEGEQWEVGRKRKRVKDREVKGLRRRVSSGEADKHGKEDEKKKNMTTEEDEVEVEDIKVQNSAKIESEKPPEKKSSLGLVEYGSDSDDD
ncbi:N-terminal domain of NEFA-interacting nuclear protein NIP30-domain-containing protein [Mariannaea sp. PMI_226]|nr:N-terminal domain of NEFA-interacting nuclear protein NIP30-domain-containing protein [Mariannaea sp. PMI_226]